MKEMSLAGAGQIGNYEMCSFRTEGTGTYIPNKKATPYSGKKGKLTFEKEIKLEMECGVEVLNNVIDALYKHHPYEEVAYEIYDFKKRNEKDEGFVVNLKTKLSMDTLFKRLNKSIKEVGRYSNKSSKRFAVIANQIDEGILKSAEFIGCDYVIQKSKDVKILET